jgi:iron-sulfur cluster repair protein YtfE (RIC family)
MSIEKPIKRTESLKPFSRDHHHALLLCWKIRTGLKRNIAVEKIKKYANWFYQTHLLPHFEEEEKLLFPVLGNDNEQIRQALADHRRLKRLFEDETEPEKSLSLIEEELEMHIRFEERILFNEIQKIATADQLKKIKQLHSDSPFCETTEDKFWE